MKNVVILGSTGSIGRNALDVIAKFPERFRVVGLTAWNNCALLQAQIIKFRPRVVAIANDCLSSKLNCNLLTHDVRPEILCGHEGVAEVAGMAEADTVISAIVGSAGLLPTLKAVRAGKTVALANKETLVMAGHIFTREVKNSGARLLPVDSEHSALFQCMNGSNRASIRKLILTASGGPFLGKIASALANVTAADALRHPNWQMGKKITIDSATLMNKGLEVIEAHYLFDIAADKISVLVHPQSIVHSLVEFIDGSCLAQLSNPDMKGPIAYSLSYPERLSDVMEPLDLEKLSGLTFLKPDTHTFPCLRLAYEALKCGGTMPAVLNAANEVAVHAFLNGVIGFNTIPVIIEKTMEAHMSEPARDIDLVITVDRWARDRAAEVIKG
jgi:1-deoxy-D-xylulose-5-phosphate reductoisomerase